MSGTYVTATGFVYPSFTENKTYWEGKFKEIFGNNIDLDPEQPIGQMVGVFAKRDTDLFEAMQEIYVSRDVDQATGVSLDTLYGERGIIRISEGSTFVSDVLLYADLSTVLSVGRQIRQSSGDYTDIIYSLTGTVTISKNNCRVAELEIGTPSTGEVFSITIDGTIYSHTTTVGQSDEDVATALETLIIAGDFVGTISRDGAVITLTQELLDFTIDYTTNITLNVIANAGSFQATTPGVYSAPVGTLDTIVTPVSGWDSVINTSAGITGRAIETDSEFRIRAANTSLLGKATEDALVNAISNNVPNITAVSIVSNRTDVINSEGMPPHSFEIVVSGGLDLDIANQIWDTQAAGIASYGSEDVVVQDSEGEDQHVFFSRPTSLYIWVKVKRALFSEESYPSAGDLQIKQAIVDWAVINQPIGLDVIRQRLSTPVYTVPGIGDIEITIDGTESVMDTPIYAEDNIVISIREKAEFDISRITVETLV